jgi:SpoVK/Ycf46/Vps4 family AAA+-type ATPase
LQIHARRLPVAADVDFDHLATLTRNMTPAEIANICNRAGLMALRQSLCGEAGSGVILPVVNAALFERILRGRKA